MQTLHAQMIASVCHEANRALCSCLGDDSQLPWNVCAEWQRQSSMDGVVAILHGKVKSPRETHSQWMVERIAMGWVWGPVKNEWAKEHPALVPWEELPMYQRRKDELFFAIVNALRKDN